MASKRKDPGRTFSPARKALSRSGIGLCLSPKRKLSTSVQSSSKLGASGRPAGRIGVKSGLNSRGASSANMKVVVRVRPLNRREQDSNAKVIVDVVDEKMVVFDPKREEESFFFHGAKQKGRDMMRKQNKHTQYLFDRVFGCEASNEEVFEGSTKSIISSVLDGFNCSVFVYGATGAGKTYTMLGSQDNPGITFRTMVDLFKQMEDQQNEKTFEIGVSYLEVYNENVKDLLNPSSVSLHLREDVRTVMVAGLKTEMITNPNRMFELLEYGNKNRSQHATDANAESSRSHAVFQVFIKMKNKMNGQTKMVKLSMIDLAGSERGAATGCAGARFKEGSNINKSLLALGNCINALADGQRHVPYRDSKLTRLLKDSLGGNCQTVMIANVAPAHLTYEDTHNTLKYATRAKSIKFQIKRNIVSVELHVSHYIKMVEDLQSENNRLKAENEKLKKESAEFKARMDMIDKPEPALQPSHLPPAVAAAVAAINIKNIKPVLSTSSIAVNTSPLKQDNEDLRRLKEAAEKLYNDKARIHLKSLNMNSSHKTLRWRIKMKQRTIDRVHAMSSTPSRMDLAQVKVDNSVRQLEGRLNSVSEYQEVVSAEEQEINNELQKIQEEMQRLGIFDEVAPYLEALRLKFLNQELLLQCKHLGNMVEYLSRGFEKHDEMLQNVSALFRKYYNLVRGHGHMNEELQREHEAVMRDLEGRKEVRWESKEPVVFQSPSEDMHIPNSPQTDVNFLLSKEVTPITSKPTGISEIATVSSLLPNDTGSVLDKVLLQSPLCSSSSNPSTVSKNMDTASMISSMEILDSKVDNILNTSVSSTAVEVGFEVEESEDDFVKQADKALNVTFEADNDLNSTFTKEDSPVKSNLNQTFDKPADSDIEPPTVCGSNMNGTFCLGKGPPQASETCNPETGGQKSPLTLTIPPPQMFSNGSPSENLAAFPSTQLKSSPLLKQSGIPLSPSSINTLRSFEKKDSSKSPPPSSFTGLSKKPQTQAGALASSAIRKSPISVPQVTDFKKTIPSSSSSTPFAVPTSAPIKRGVAGGSVVKRKDFGANGLPIKSTNAAIGKDRKFLSSGSRLHMNTPSKVKLAWNKENRNTNAVTTLKSFPVSKVNGAGGSTTKLTVRPPVTPIPLNDTFTKPPPK